MLAADLLCRELLLSSENGAPIALLDAKGCSMRPTINRLRPDNPLNPINRIDLGNPVSPLNRVNPNNPLLSQKIVSRMFPPTHHVIVHHDFRIRVPAHWGCWLRAAKTQ
jgi:hypothetical protein